MQGCFRLYEDRHVVVTVESEDPARQVGSAADRDFHLCAARTHNAKSLRANKLCLRHIEHQLTRVIIELVGDCLFESIHRDDVKFTNDFDHDNIVSVRDDSESEQPSVVKDRGSAFSESRLLHHAHALSKAPAIASAVPNKFAGG
jgi:hypothetical protein